MDATRYALTGRAVLAICQRLVLPVTAATAALVLLAAVLSVQAGALAAPLAPEAVAAVAYADDLSGPVDIANTGVATDTRLFVVERAGRIKVVVRNGATGTVLPTPFLDIDGIVDSSSHGEMGLLGLAFSPNYAVDGAFYVYYNRNQSDIHVARYMVSSNPNVANVTGTVVMTIPHPSADNHNGGDLAFGPDGFLYLAPGDGGNTPQEAQNINSLLGKVLRIHVTGQVTYTVPVTNPFSGATPGRDEIWAMGLRNPFRFSFDRDTGAFYVGDVGQGDWEEINFQPANSTGGENYGWPCYEGLLLRNQPNGCADDADYTMPVAEYCNLNQSGCTNGGRAVIGGHVYRGPSYLGLRGYYFFADNNSDRFWAMQAEAPWTVTPLGINNVDCPSSFGEDVFGELYVVGLCDGTLYRLQGYVVQVVETPMWLPAVLR